jgi:hypothetical protein
VTIALIIVGSIFGYALCAGAATAAFCRIFGPAEPGDEGVLWLAGIFWPLVFPALFGVVVYRLLVTPRPKKKKTDIPRAQVVP